MDRISLLSDDLIFKILSFAPSKVAVTTSLLSKRWTCLWKLVPTLNYRDPNQKSELWRASWFVDKFLLLRKDGFLETMNLSLSSLCPASAIATWVLFAVSHGVRHLQLVQRLQYHQYRDLSKPIWLPRSLFTCETLGVLSLENMFIEDVPLAICFRSLKVFSLTFVNFQSDQVVHRLLSGCPVLEELTVIRWSIDIVKTYTIPVPSLQRLTVANWSPRRADPVDDYSFVIEAPSLKSLTIVMFNSFCSLVNMPELVNANINLMDGGSKKLLGCLTSAKHLSLSLKPPMNSYPIGVFNQLVSLKLCTCSSDWCLLILKNTPKLRVLRFELQVTLLPNRRLPPRCCKSWNGYKGSSRVHTQWEQPSPECLISSLETVEWIGYKGTTAEKKVLMYLLENSRLLKTMAIRSMATYPLEEKHKMLQELASTQRGSIKCRLSFM